MKRAWVLLLLLVSVSVPSAKVRACDNDKATASAAARDAREAAREAVREAREAAREAERDAAEAARDAAQRARDAEQAVRDAEEAVRDAERAAMEVARQSACDQSRQAVHEVDRALLEALRERMRAQLRAAAAVQPGVIVTPNSLLYVDGPEVPLEWVEWADGVGSRRMRHATDTDTVLSVTPGTRLVLANLSGDINVQVWDRNEVRIQAEHDREDHILAEFKNDVLRLKVDSGEGEPADVEWSLTVPRWLPLELSGMESEIAVTGMRSAVSAKSMRGDVVVRSCQGPLEVHSVEGEVHVSDVSGSVTAESINSIVRLVRVTGSIEAQTINGDIQLEKLASSSVDASTVNGRVIYASPFQTDGRYVFSSHNGKLYVGLPTDQRVKVKLSSFNGQVESTVPMPTPAPEPEPSGRVVRFNHGRTMYFTTGMPGEMVYTATPPNAPNAPSAPTAPGAPRTPRPPSAPHVARGPQAPELELESFHGLIQLASQEEALRAIDAQRVAYDSLRSSIQRARRELARARRMSRPSEPAPAPEAPSPPPPPPHR